LFWGFNVLPHTIALGFSSIDIAILFSFLIVFTPKILAIFLAPKLMEWKRVLRWTEVEEDISEILEELS
jgi:hypothetical protein